MADGGEKEQPIVGQQARGRHINKRALKNKALSVTFDEKDLRYSAITAVLLTFLLLLVGCVGTVFDMCFLV